MKEGKKEKKNQIKEKKLSQGHLSITTTSQTYNIYWFPCHNFFLREQLEEQDFALQEKQSG